MLLLTAGTSTDRHEFIPTQLPNLKCAFSPRPVSSTETNGCAIDCFKIKVKNLREISSSLTPERSQRQKQGIESIRADRVRNRFFLLFGIRVLLNLALLIDHCFSVNRKRIKKYEGNRYSFSFRFRQISLYLALEIGDKFVVSNSVYHRPFFFHALFFT